MKTTFDPTRIQDYFGKTFFALDEIEYQLGSFGELTETRMSKVISSRLFAIGGIERVPMRDISQLMDRINQANKKDASYANIVQSQVVSFLREHAKPPKEGFRLLLGVVNPDQDESDCLEFKWPFPFKITQTIYRIN